MEDEKVQPEAKDDVASPAESDDTVAANKQSEEEGLLAIVVGSIVLN